MKMGFIAFVGTASLVASADAGFLGLAAFSRTASNGNVVVDLVAVTQRASDRVLSVYNANTSSTFIQQAGITTRGFKPDAATNTRANIVDSFCTIGSVFDYGDYYANGNSAADGNFTTGWSTLGTTMPANAGWFTSPPTDAVTLSESLSNFSGLRANSSGATAAGTFGVWLGHWVFAPGTTSAIISLGVFVKDGITGTTVDTYTTNFQQMVPAPGALAILGLAGMASRRRRA
jgi:hypothetical protein